MELVVTGWKQQFWMNFVTLSGWYGRNVLTFIPTEPISVVPWNCSGILCYWWLTLSHIDTTYQCLLSCRSGEMEHIHLSARADKQQWKWRKVEDGVCNSYGFPVVTCCREIISLIFVLWLSLSQAGCKTVTDQLLLRGEILQSLAGGIWPFLLKCWHYFVFCYFRLWLLRQVWHELPGWYSSQLYLRNSGSLWWPVRGLHTTAIAPAFPVRLNQRDMA